MGRLGHESHGECNDGSKIVPQKYKWDAKKKLVSCISKAGQYGTTELITLHVYDLYYKKKAISLEMWWKELASYMGGTIKLGLPHNIDD